MRTLSYTCTLVAAAVMLFVSSKAEENMTTTESPEAFTTSLFFTTSVTDTFSMDSMDSTAIATDAPSKSISPTAAPSTNPTIAVGKDEDILVSVLVSLRGDDIDEAWVNNNKAPLIQIFKDTLDDDEGYQIEIGKVTEITEEDTETARRRLLQTVVGVNVEYLVVIAASGASTTRLNTLETVVTDGSFVDSFEVGVESTFGSGVVTVEEVEYELQGTGDGAAFLGQEEETFGEKLSAEYWILGLVFMFVGTVWLFKLRSPIVYKTPNYASGQAETGGAAIEMVPQTSGGDTR